MTEIKVWKTGKHYRVDAENHADTEEVCHGVSALLYALDNALLNNDGVICRYSDLKSGKAVIEAITETESAEEDFKMFLIGVMAIQLSHLDEVSIVQNVYSSIV